MNFFKRRKILRKANFLDLTPVRMLQDGETEDGRFYILVPRFKSPILTRMFLPRYKSTHFRIFLDDIGKLTWLSIDGDRNVASLCSILEAEFGDKIHPVEERATKYLSRLYEQRYISFKEIL